MIALIKKVIKDCLTEDDGQSYCGAKVASFIALFCYLGNVTYAIHSAQTLDFSAFGTGLASVLAGCGALIAGKQLSKKD